MKKIFTLLFAAGMFTLVQAQPDFRNNRQNDQRNNSQNDQRGYNNGNGKVVIDGNISFGNTGRYDERFSPERRRDMEIARINQAYDYKVQSVRNSYFMGWREKKRQIRFLEEQRRQEIRNIYDSFRYQNRYDDHQRYSKHGHDVYSHDDHHEYSKRHD